MFTNINCDYGVTVLYTFHCLNWKSYFNTVFTLTGPHWQMEPVITSAQRYTDNGAELIKGEGRKGVVGGCVVGWTHYFLTIPSSSHCTFLLSFLKATLTPKVFPSQWVFAEQLIATLSFESFFFSFHIYLVFIRFPFYLISFHSQTLTYLRSACYSDWHFCACFVMFIQKLTLFCSKNLY